MTKAGTSRKKGKGKLRNKNADKNFTSPSKNKYKKDPVLEAEIQEKVILACEICNPETWKAGSEDYYKIGEKRKLDRALRRDLILNNEITDSY